MYTLPLYCTGTLHTLSYTASTNHKSRYVVDGALAGGGAGGHPAAMCRHGTRAVLVDIFQVDPGFESTWVKPVESTSPFKSSGFSDDCQPAAPSTTTRRRRCWRTCAPACCRTRRTSGPRRSASQRQTASSLWPDAQPRTVRTRYIWTNQPFLSLLGHTLLLRHGIGGVPS